MWNKKMTHSLDTFNIVCYFSNCFFVFTSTEKPDKPAREEKAAQSSSTAEQQRHNSQPEEEREAAAELPQKDAKKDSRRCVFVLTKEEECFLSRDQTD